MAVTATFIGALISPLVFVAFFAVRYRLTQGRQSLLY